MTDERPQIENYQRRVSEGAATAIIRRDQDVLIQAPTGAGKTAIIARTAEVVSRLKGKVLILTHRKALFRQMVGTATADSEKARMGEILFWSGVRPGQIADETLGGMDQTQGIVVAMVETAANRKDQLADYAAIFIDETHHASEMSEGRENKGSYAEVIEACPHAKIVGLTATIFRGDGDRLHPRLENGHREVIGIEEARASGRIVPPRTIIGRARLEDGSTPHDLGLRESEGRLDGASASAMVAKLRGESFWEQGVEDWERLAKGAPTIVFVDRQVEVDRMQSRFAARYGEGVAVMVHGDRSGEENDAAMKAYAEGRAKVLISCKMIGEGYDVPATDAVMSFNASLSRAEMMQYAGRALRASPGKSEGLFIDYGTATARHGRVEDQQAVQSVDALAASRSEVTVARSIGIMAPVEIEGWRAMPGRDRSLLLHSSPQGCRVFELDHRKERELGRRAGQKAGSVTGLEEIPSKTGRLMPLRDAAQLLSDLVRDEAGFYARDGGFADPAHAARSEAILNSWLPVLKYIVPPAAVASEDEAARRRREIVEADLQGRTKGGVDSRLVRKALENAPSGAALVRDGLALTGAAMRICATHDDVALGARAQARAASTTLSERRLSRMTPGKLRQEGTAARDFLKVIESDAGDAHVGKVLKDIREPMEKGLRMLEKEIRLEKRAAR